jgi:hypothetical protein
MSMTSSRKHLLMNTSEEIDVDAELDALSNRVDYSLVQGGEDLARRKSSMGYHYTSHARLASIQRSGLGGHPSSIEDHETELWLVTFVTGEKTIREALELLDKGGESRRGKAQDLVQQALDRVKDLRVLWYYKDASEFGTSKYSDVCVSFNLQEIGDWIGEHADLAYSFSDGADGHAVAWRGPAIPLELLSECDED